MDGLQLRDDRGQIATSRIATDCDARRIDTQFGGVGVGPAQCIHRIGEWLREGMFRSEAVVDTQHGVAK